MAFKNSTGKSTVTKYGEPYLWGSGDVSTFNTNELSTIYASDGAAGDLFGDKVAVGCGRIVIGAPGDDTNTGSAYIFDAQNNVQMAKIQPSDLFSGDKFGQSVAVGCGRIVVGALFDDVGANLNQGSAYIFDLDGTQLTKITASDGAADDEFGNSVAVGCGRIVVGAPYHTGSGSGPGSVYIFDLDGTQLAKITPSDGAYFDLFGDAVAVGCGRIVVGAYADDDKGLNSGSAYIFDLDGTQLAKITASDGFTFGRFGENVVVGNGRIVVGAYNNNSRQGSAYIYDLDGNQLAQVTNSDGATGDKFGQSVAVGNGRIVVGAYDDNGSRGAAYLFNLDGTLLHKYTVNGGVANDEFGYSVAVGNGRIVVGGKRDAGNGFQSGSAKIYQTPRVYTPYDLIYNEV